MLGDILQDSFGWFYRDNGDGTADNLSADGGESPDTAPKTTIASIADPVVLVRSNEPTGQGDRLAARVALTLAKRYA